jgi:hypothetical protein
VQRLSMASWVASKCHLRGMYLGIQLAGFLLLLTVALVQQLLVADSATLLIERAARSEVRTLGLV